MQDLETFNSKKKDENEVFINRNKNTRSKKGINDYATQTDIYGLNMKDFSAQLDLISRDMLDDSVETDGR